MNVIHLVGGQAVGHQGGYIQCLDTSGIEDRNRIRVYGTGREHESPN